MKCHCGKELLVFGNADLEHPMFEELYYYCGEHGFQGWVNTDGFEYND